MSSRRWALAVAAGYEWAGRNFRRLVAEVKAEWRRTDHRGRRPAVWAPGEHLVLDWGVLGGLHMFCAVLAWSRVRFVRFAADERAATTMSLLAECFETVGGVPKVVLAARMACLRADVVAGRVVTTSRRARMAGEGGSTNRPATPSSCRPPRDVAGSRPPGRGRSGITRRDTRRRRRLARARPRE